MGLKTNKATKTSRLNCQYVGSFSVSDSGRKLTLTEQKKYVDEKLMSCEKKLIAGITVCIEVSPDGVRVLAEDEKTVKMAHPLRRISYATAEASNKLFAYVSHQPGTDMEIVCHTFLTRKKDHAEGLSAALGKLFKQTFAYTLKRRDKLEEAAQKRGANRRWAKQQVSEGHGVSPHARNAARNVRQQASNVDESPKGNAFTSPQTKALSPTSIAPSSSPANSKSTSRSSPITPSSPPANSKSTSRISPMNQSPSPSPKRNISDSSIGSSSFESQSRAVRRDTAPGDDVLRARKHSAPPDLKPSFPSPNLNGKPRRSSASCTEEVSPTWLTSTQGLEKAASALLAGAGDTPPPLPRRPWETVDQRGHETTSIPEEVISFDEDERLRQSVAAEPRVSMTLEDEDWYIPGVSRDMVTELLETSDTGTFFVRDSQSRPGCYALTMKVLKGPNNPSGFANYLIVPERDGFALQGFDKVFDDISTLIRHHASFDDGLPCRLVLAGSNPLFHDANGYLAEFMDEEDQEYTSLSNCTSMFQELKMNGNVPW